MGTYYRVLRMVSDCMPVQYTSAIATSLYHRTWLIFRKSDISGMPLFFFGGGGENFGGGRVVSRFILVTFFPNRIIFRHPFNFNHISAPAPPSFMRPWGTTLHRDLAIFFSFLISLDPKEAKSAKKSKSIFPTDSPLNRVRLV